MTYAPISQFPSVACKHLAPIYFSPPRVFAQVLTKGAAKATFLVTDTQLKDLPSYTVPIGNGMTACAYSMKHLQDKAIERFGSLANMV